MSIITRVWNGALTSLLSTVALGLAFSLVPLLSPRGGWSDFVSFLAFYTVVGIPFACFVLALYGLPLYLLLHRLGAASLTALTVCGAAGGLLAAALLSKFEPGRFYVMAGGTGACVGATFWYGAARCPFKMRS